MTIREVRSVFRPITGTVTLDANGNGTITLQPGSHWLRWEVTHVNVKTSQASGTTPVPTAEVYVNDSAEFANHHGGTRDGDLDVSRGRVPMDGTDVLLVVFTGGIAGTTAFASAFGEYTARVGFG